MTQNAAMIWNRKYSCTSSTKQQKRTLRNVDDLGIARRHPSLISKGLGNT